MDNLTLSIMGRDYRVACAPDEKSQLLACAQYLDQRMTAIRDGGRVLGADNVAVLAALQIAQEMFSARNADGLAVGELRRRLRDLNALADDMLAPQEKLF
jgi:cell division protein ZapA